MKNRTTDSGGQLFRGRSRLRSLLASSRCESELARLARRIATGPERIIAKPYDLDSLYYIAKDRRASRQNGLY
jgi:hypothetical protein